MANIQHVAQKLAVEWKAVLQISVSQKAAFGRCRHSFVGSLLTRLGSITGTVPLGTIMAAIQSPSPSACQRTIGPLATDVRNNCVPVLISHTSRVVLSSIEAAARRWQFCGSRRLTRRPARDEPTMALGERVQLNVQMLSIATNHFWEFDWAGKLGMFSADIVWMKGNANCASNDDE